MDGVSAVSAVASLVLLGTKVTMQAHGFLSKAKDCPNRVKNIEADLKSTNSILNQLEDLLEESKKSRIAHPLEHNADFRDAIEALRELFAELAVLIKKYEGTSLWKRTRWASTGQDEAMQLARLLSTQKSNMQFMLMLSQNGTLSTIRQGVDGNSDELRILMGQVQAIRANGMGFQDPRMETWFESVAEYEGTASVVGTVPESCLDDTSPTNSRRNSGEVERNGSWGSTRRRNRHFDGTNGQPPKRKTSAAQRAKLSVMKTVPEGSVDNLSINRPRSSFEEATVVDHNKSAVVQNTLIKLKDSRLSYKSSSEASEDTAADHEDTASVADTVKESHSDNQSLPGSIRNSGEFTVVVRPREVVQEVEQIQMQHNFGDFVSGGWQKRQTWLESVTEYGGTSSVVETLPERAFQLSKSMSLTEFEIRHNIWDGNAEGLMLNNHDRTKASDGRNGLVHLPPIIYRCIQYLRYALHRPWHNISFWPYGIEAYYDEDGLLMLPPNFEAVPGDRRTKAGDLSSDVGGYLWRKFASGHDINLLNIDWSLWPAPEDTINCVGDLFMQNLYKVHAPIIPPDIGRYYDDPYYFGSFTEFENSLHEPELTDDKYLLLCQLLSFLQDLSLAAHHVEDTQRLFPKAFRGLFGVGEVFALHLIVKHQEFLTMPEQDGNKNTFSFETTFSSKLPLPQPPLIAQLEEEVTLAVELPTWEIGLLRPKYLLSHSGELNQEHPVYLPLYLSFKQYEAPQDTASDAPTSLSAHFPQPLNFPPLSTEERATAVELPTTVPRPKNAKYKAPGVTEALYLIRRRQDLSFTQWVPPEPALESKPEPDTEAESESEPEPASSTKSPLAQPRAMYTYPQLSDEDEAIAVEIGPSDPEPKAITFGFSEKYTFYLIGRRQDLSFKTSFAEWCHELGAVWESVQKPPQSPQSIVAPPSPRPMTAMSCVSYMSPANDTSYGGSLIISQIEMPNRVHSLQWPAMTPLTPSQLELPVTTPLTTSQFALPAKTLPTTSQLEFPIWDGAVELPTKPSEGMRFWGPSCEPWKPIPVLERRRVPIVLMHKCSVIAAFKKDHSCMAYCCWESANDWLKSCNRT